MSGRFDDVDYSSLAGKRRGTVVLVDVKIHQCPYCGESQQLVEIPHMGALERELAAAGSLRAKELWCSFEDGEWSILLKPTSGLSKRRRRRRSAT